MGPCLRVLFSSELLSLPSRIQVCRVWNHALSSVLLSHDMKADSTRSGAFLEVYLNMPFRCLSSYVLRSSRSKGRFSLREMGTESSREALSRLWFMRSSRVLKLLNRMAGWTNVMRRACADFSVFRRLSL